MSVPAPVTHLTFHKAYSIIILDSGEYITTKCLLIAMRVDYPRLGAEDEGKFEKKARILLQHQLKLKCVGEAR